MIYVDTCCFDWTKSMQINPQKFVKAFDTEVNVVGNDDHDVTITGLRRHQCVTDEKNSDLRTFAIANSYKHGVTHGMA